MTKGVNVENFRVCLCARTHHAVEAVEGGVEVGLDAQTIHLDQHLRHEQTEEDKLCIDWRKVRERE